MLPIRILYRAISKKKINSIHKLRELHKRAFSDKYLLITNVSISLGLSSVGDFLEQKYEKFCGQITKWDQKRTVHMALSGLSVGVICHFWYKYLDSFMPGRTISIILKKVILDQLICSPIYISVFFITLAILENKSWNETIIEIKEKAWKLYAAEWAIWPIAQVINFYWLPTKYRILYDNTISLGYDVFTSNVKYNT